MPLQVRSQVTQWCPRRVSYRNDRTGGFPRCAVGLVLVRGREIPCCTEVELFKEQPRDKVRSWFTLLVTARVGGTTGQAPMYWWSWLLSLSATHPERGNDNGCLGRK